MSEPDVQSDMSDGLDEDTRDQIAFDPTVEEPIEGLGDQDDGGSVEYQITSYGADYPVDGLVKRLKRGDIFVPPFQRAYVWTQPKASRFIESLLMGLPVPGVFLAREASNKLLVIDGQQRLKTLEYFCRGVFGSSGREFRLRGIKSRFENLTYDTLHEDDRRRLDDYTIHATIIQQDEPKQDDSSVYHIFERLNTGGMQLVPQEIRACVYHGSFVKLLADLNENSDWRTLYGPESKRMRDRELILRFFAFLDSSNNYKRPMNDFLNGYMASKRTLSSGEKQRLTETFERTVAKANRTLGRAAFRPIRAFNASVFDSVMVALSERIEAEPNVKDEEIKAAFAGLMKNGKYLTACMSSTTDETNVDIRLSAARGAFGLMT